MASFLSRHPAQCVEETARSTFLLSSRKSRSRCRHAPSRKEQVSERNALPPLPFTTNRDILCPDRIRALRTRTRTARTVPIYMYLAGETACFVHAWLCVVVRAGGNSTAVTLPADPLKSGKVSIKGTISVTDQSKANVASIMLDLTVE